MTFGTSRWDLVVITNRDMSLRDTFEKKRAFTEISDKGKK